MQPTEKLRRLTKAKVPQGKSVRVNLKLSEAALKSFNDLKNRKACKVNAEVFDYICDFADMISKVQENDESSSFLKGFSTLPPSTTRKIFTLNQYILAKLRTIAKASGISTDEVVNGALVLMDQLVKDFKNNEEIREKYSDGRFVLNEISEIWSRVSDLRDGMEAVFTEDYYDENPESLGWWLANIETSLQEVNERVTVLFEQQKSKEESEK